MTTDSTEATKHWYALKVFYNRVFAIETYLNEAGIESYIPCEKEKIRKTDGTYKTIRKTMTPSLMFFRSDANTATLLRRELFGQVLIYVDSAGDTNEPCPISDHEMDVFILVTSSGEKGIEYFSSDDRRFHVGERVRVTGGSFKGTEGYIRRIKGNRRLIVTIHGICAVATSYIPQCFLEKIEE